MAVDTDHARFSSAGGITIGGAGGTPMPPRRIRATRPGVPFQFDGFGMFIAMDPPKHDVQRATVASVVAPRNLACSKGSFVTRGPILDSLPLDESFDWVTVSRLS